MKNRKLLLIVSLVLALTMSLGGTLAYLTDTDEAVNVMTLGNVKIEQHEKDAAGNIFEQGQPLYPAYIEGENITGAIDKVVTVENTGNSDAYVRTWIAFEVGTMAEDRFAAVIHKEIAKEGLTLSEGKFIEIEDVNYYVVCATYDEALAAGKTTTPSLMKVYMDPDAKNEDVANFGETYEILVYTQAVQTKNMEHLTPAQALSAGFGDEHPWVDGVNELPTKVVKTAAELKTALENGGIIVVANDVTVSETLQVKKGATAQLILKGDLSYAVANVSASAIINNNGNLTISGNGTISFVAANPDMDAIPSYATNTITNEGSLTIEDGVTVTNGSDGGASYAVDNKGVFYLNGGTLKGERCALRIAKYNQDNVVFVMNGGLVEGATPAWIQLAGNDASVAPTITVTINDGTFKSTKVSNADNDVLYTYSFGNSHANTTVTINGGNFLGGTVSIGSGYKGDAPALNINGGNFEYDVLRWGSNDTSDVLFESNMAVATDAKSLKDAVAAGKYVMLTDDVTAPLSEAAIYGTPVAVIQKNGGVIDGNGNSLIIENPKYEGYAIETWGGTIKNLTIDTAVGRGIVISSPKEDIYIDNVVVDGPGYAINTTEHSPKKLVITNSTVNGWTSLAGLEVATFTNCNLGENSSKYWQNMGYDKDYDRLVRPYCNAVFTTCVFEQGYYIDLSALGADCKMTLNGCTTNGNKITAENYTTYITIELPSGRTLADCVIFK